jgi:hypothetical protein
MAKAFYQYAKDTLESGKIQLPKRQQFRRLRQEIGVFDLQVARRDRIKKIANLAKSNPRLASRADHFMLSLRGE